MGLVVVSIRTVMTFVTGFRRCSADRKPAIRRVWLRYAHWLVAGLTFQLAADIVQPAITPDWPDIRRLIATAVIRTFLDYFLVRDLTEVGGRVT